jgi:hypothetical protein
MQSRGGLLKGKTIELDEPMPPLDGKRVVVTIEADESGEVLSTEGARTAWDAWAASANQGPLQVDDDADFPQ